MKVNSLSSYPTHNKALQLTQLSTLVYEHSLRLLLHNTHYNRCAIEFGVRGLMDKQSEQCKEVYAYFGLTIYSAQCLEQAMIHLIVFLDHFPKAAPNFSTTDKWEEDFDKFFEGESQKTMGQLLGRLQKLGIPCEELKIKLKEALNKRNWLAHAYFSERAMEFMSEDGRNKMISELEKAAEFFKSIDEEVSSIFYKIAETYGLTDDVFKKIMDEMLVEAKSDL